MPYRSKRLARLLKVPTLGQQHAHAVGGVRIVWVPRQCMRVELSRLLKLVVDLFSRPKSIRRTTHRRGPMLTSYRIALGLLPRQAMVQVTQGHAGVLVTLATARAHTGAAHHCRLDRLGVAQDVLERLARRTQLRFSHVQCRQRRPRVGIMWVDAGHILAQLERFRHRLTAHEQVGQAQPRCRPQRACQPQQSCRHAQRLASCATTVRVARIVLHQSAIPRLGRLKPPRIVVQPCLIEAHSHPQRQQCSLIPPQHGG
jgi:hypothetical protein